MMNERPLTIDSFRSLPDLDQVGLLLTNGQLMRDEEDGSLYRIADFFVKVRIGTDQIRVLSIVAFAEPALQ